jgi:quinoprotein glucose dehydrogenase
MSRWIRSLALLALFGLVAFAVPPEEEKKQKKKGENSPESGAARAQIEGGLKATVWAAEPMFQNPVCFAFDEAGKCYVAEANRYQNGVPDTRGHMYWLDEDIGSKSVADRVAMYKKHKFPQHEKFDDKIRVLWDSTGSGLADKAETFSGGYNRFEDGIGSGLLARKGTVYYTCIPDLYALKDTKGDGKADVKTSLATGFGVRVQFVGHDMHGLRIGPDGKLYFSIGDRGFNVVNKEGKRLYNPDSGAVLRCDLDGSNMEIVHSGLRNPQELAFDDFGNLFTYDNNCDSGDSARWVQIVEGGDSGWRCGYQYGTHMHTPAVPQQNRGPWNTEKLWHLQNPDQPAYIVPPLAHFGNGPSGLTHYPGVGLNDRYKDHFFACDFTASAGNSKIWTLAVKPKGASFEVVDLHPFAQQVVPTDCEFGPDGAFYWSDWIGGWDKPNKGRIFRAVDPEAMKNPAIEEGRKLLADGLEKLNVDELVKLLAHPHQNVRLEAQFELANKAKADHKNVAFKLAALAQGKKANRLARLHAIWGLGMIEGGGKNSSLLLQSAKTLFKDEDVEVRAATAKTLGKYVAAWSALDTQLKAESDNRVKSHLLVSMGKLLPENSADQIAKETSPWLPAFEVLKSNADVDVYLRQAAIECLTQACLTYDDRYRVGPTRVIRNMLGQARDIDSTSVKIGLVVALRKLSFPRGPLPGDDDPKLLSEIARAIHDDDLSSAFHDIRMSIAMPALAALLDKPALPEAVAFRAVSANLKLGTPEAAARVANFAARSAESDPLRISALKLLGEWAKPSKRDAVTGCRQELPDRDPAIAANAVKPVVAKLFVGSDAVRKEAVQLVAKLGLTEVGALLTGMVADAKLSGSTRAESLFALEALKAKELNDTAKAALESSIPKLRAAARVVLAKANPTAAAKDLPALLKDEQAATIEKQMAFGVLGTMKESQEIDAALAEWLDNLIADKVPDALKLDVLEAAEARTRTRNLKLHAPLREKLADYDKQTRAKAAGDMVKRNLEALSGGDAERGREIVLNNAAVYCTRCHKLDGQGGDVGPALNGIAAMKDRLYLLESIVNPNAKIAMGYQSVIIDTLDGKQVSGIVKTQTAKEITLITAENKLITIPADDVDGKPKPDKSAMPEDLYKKISKRELRDVVEFLATMKEPAKN